MATVQHVNARKDANKITEILKKDGCVVLEGLLEQEESDTLSKQLTDLFQEIPDCQGDFYGHATKRLGALFTKAPLFVMVK